MRRDRMALRDINLKKSYDSDFDDILNQFYIPVLSNSFMYHRLAGFFSSTSLALAARGIARFIANDGHMKLICGAKLREKDVRAVKEAGENPQKIVEKMMINDLEQMEEEFIRNHVRALAWMIAHNTLEIKVAIVTDKDGLPVEAYHVENQGIFHQKIGILQDEKEDMISFSGSCNESAAAWQSNIEEFKVFCSWNPHEEEYIKSDMKRFGKFWNNASKRAKVIDIPEAIREKLIQIAPDTIEELEIEKWTSELFENSTGIHLWNHQRQAISNWLNNGGRGIFEMATGTGKTFTALGCLEEIMKKTERIIVVIACPYDHLVKQWCECISQFHISSEIVIADSSNPYWKDQLADHIYDIKNDINDRLVVLTTHATFSGKEFQDILGLTNEKKFLIVDEVHGIGAPQRKKGLVEDYLYRLGLSATPRRWFDSEGTNKLFGYFGDTVFEFSLGKAIRTINPSTGQTYLTAYEYKPYFVALTNEELEKYEKETRRIAKTYYQTKKEEMEKLYTQLCIRRQKIVKNATNKYEAFEKILDSLDQVHHCLVYCSPQQIGRIQDILNKRNIIQHEFTMKEGTTPRQEYKGLSEREFLLKKFADGTYHALVAMKCLDEGVDVPQARTAIILSSSGNPRQYIQRRGRVLRHSPGKEKAVIYDIIVEPLLSGIMEPDLVSLEKKIFEKELKRYKEFAFDALNAMECLRRIEEIEKKYRIWSG
jgi:superfamily II DNA or RNA helicase